MRAMILAAGLGTRLRPITDNRPKALVEVGGRTLLEITLTRLRGFGIKDVIINAHHFADMLVDYLKQKSNFGMNLEVSREQILLDTGGGLKKAARFFFSSADRAEPFVLHNVDVISSIDLGRMLQFHNKQHALATLAMQDRKTSRYLLFNSDSQLCGRQSGQDQTAPVPGSGENVQALAFCGIHIISPRLLTMMMEDGAFSIINTYLRLSAAGERILSFRADDYYWRDLGRPEDLAQAAQDIEQNASLA